MTASSGRVISRIGAAVAIAAFITAISCKAPKPVEGFDLLVQPLDTTISLAAWLAARPHDTSLFDAPAGASNDDLCKSAEGQVPIAGSIMTRYALFYIPDPPKGEGFPADTALFAREACHVRSIWAVREIDDTAQARAFADSLAGALSARLGSAKPGAEIRGLGTGAWQHASTWRIGDERVVLATEAPTNYKSPETGKVSLHHGRVIVAAYTARSGFLPPNHDGPAVNLPPWMEADTALRNARVDSVLRLPGIAASAADLHAITAVARIHGSSNADLPQIRSAALDSAIVRVVQRARAAAPALDGPHRAAALMQADVALDAYAPSLGGGDSTGADPLLATLRGSGAGFEHDAKRGDIYTRSLLWDAYRADSLGPAGHLAFMELLSKAWWTRPTCGADRNGFDRIIEHGGAALRRGDRDPAIHYYLADAYRNIYALAHGAESEYANAKEFEPKSEAARDSALTHYREALHGLQGNARRVAWDQAMRLLIRAHTGSSYYCAFD